MDAGAEEARARFGAQIGCGITKAINFDSGLGFQQIICQIETLSESYANSPGLPVTPLFEAKKRRLKVENSC